MNQGEIDSIHGRSATAVLLLQDIAVIPFTVIVSILVSSEKSFDINSLLVLLISVVGLVVFLYILLNKIAIPILSMFTLENNREMSILLAVIIGIGSAWSAHVIGVSPAIGAFIAGMMLGSSAFATQITADVAPLKIIFLTLFFGSVGMVADPIWIFQNLALILTLTFAILLVKILITFTIFKSLKNTVAVSLTTALITCQIGEFAFVLSTIGKNGNLISEELHQIIFSVTILSILITAILIKDSSKIGLIIHNMLSKKKSWYLAPEIEEDLENPKIFILGFGPSGKEVGTILKDKEYKNITIIDLNRSSTDDATIYGFKSYIGDIRQLEVLQHFGIGNADLVIITVPSQEASLQAIDNIKRLNSKAFILVRSRYQISIEAFKKAGAHEIISEENIVGKFIGEKSLEYLEVKQ
jgi:CPA2 family monovalent cation:H+ antiporter-2